MSPDPDQPQPRILVVLPALNEEVTVALVVKEVQAAIPECTILVVDDGSVDHTGAQALEAGAQVVTNPFTLGVGGAMRVGFRVAKAHDFDILLQVDADGQHDARDIAVLLAELDDEPGPQVVIGARFAGSEDFAVPRARRIAMKILAHHLSRVTKTHLTDVTSGFRAHNRAAIELFAVSYPADYLSDTIESLVIVTDAGGRVHQVPVTMRPRLAGSPSQSPGRAALYLVRVVMFLALSVFRRRTQSTQQPTMEEL
jgi:glycosyltransferase involved in cell wall biosynthesis